MSNHVLEDACTSDTSSDGEGSVGPTAAEKSMEKSHAMPSTSPPLSSQPMDPQLLKAATSGDSESLHGMASQHPGVLHGRTPAGNTCLHIATAHGHLEFCKQVLELNQSLLTAVNADNETPLVIAVKNGHASLASVLLALWRCQRQLTDASAILQKDKNGCNALHHAIRGGHEKLALELIAIEVALSSDVNNKEESPMFIAAVKNLTDVIKKLLENPDSPHGGPCSQNALHAAVRKGNPDIARLIMETRPQLAREENADKSSPMHQAIHDKKIDIVTVLLEHDPSLGYLLCSKSDAPPLNSAAAVGDVDIARELLKHCPDTPYCDKSGFTCLHEAVSNGHTGFVEFLLRSKQLSPLVNMQDHEGRTALHIAAEKRNSKIIPALLLHQGIDITLPNNSGKTARQVLPAATEDKKETIWIPDGAATTVSPSTGSVAMMDGRLLEAATSGDTSSIMVTQPALRDPGVLLATTPQGNTCLHIASAHGHLEFCKQVLELNQSLLTAVNADNETPLVVAVKNGHASLASVLLAFRRGHQQRRDAVLQKDQNGCNALHHAIHGGHRGLALELITTEPGLSRDVNKEESPMFIAAVKNFADVVAKLLEISDSSHGGPSGQNALHAAVGKGNPDIVRSIMKARPWLAREENGDMDSPMRKAVREGKIDIVAVLLQHDRSLGYLLASNNAPLLNYAAAYGHVGVARELLKHCPDAPYCSKSGFSCLHAAAWNGHTEFAQFVLGSKHLQQVIDMQEKNGKTALHIAAEKRDSRLISALLLHQGIDITLLNNKGKTARQVLAAATKDNADSIWIPDGAATTVSPSTGSVAMMDGRLLEAATSGDTSPMVMQPALRDPAVLLATTPQGNTCLHIASARGHQEFCNYILELNLSLLTSVNADNETPLVVAVKSGHASLASVLLARCRGHQQLSDASVLLQKDNKNGCHVLHHAIRSGYEKLALDLIAAEPALSRDVNKNLESPMFIAAVKSFTHVVEKLLEISDSAHGGPGGQNALHAAVGKGNLGVVRKIMETRPSLAREEDGNKFSPMTKAISLDKIDILTVLLEHDPSLGYVINSSSVPPLSSAAAAGHVGIARELLKHCPDTPYYDKSGSTCLHEAVSNGHTGFVEFLLRSKQLPPLVNMQDHQGRTALHIAAEKRNARMISVLVFHKGIDITLPNNNGQTARQVLPAPAATEDNQEDNEDSIWIPDGEAVPLCPGAVLMDRRLLDAAKSGHTSSIPMELNLGDPAVLLATTPQGNTCLHIASAQGHLEFCMHVLNWNQSLIETVNADGETPLLTAVTSGQVPLALFLLTYSLQRNLSGVIIKQDKNGCNVLHHAIRSRLTELAIKFIEAMPVLSKAVNKYDESPMFIAVMRDIPDVVNRLLQVPDSAHGGSSGYNALHAAVRNDNQGIAQMLVRERPELAREETCQMMTPMEFAALENKIGVLRVLLQHDYSLGFVISTSGRPLLNVAARRGHDGIAKELLERCPDAPYLDTCDGMTCLHEAVTKGQQDFVEFVLQSKQLRKLINMRDKDGDTALHCAIRNCNPKIVAALLRHQDTDLTILSNKGNPAVWLSSDGVDQAKTLNWNEVCSLLLNADPKDEGEIRNVYKEVKDGLIEKSRSDIRSLTQTYTNNTSLIAILIATITFAAAFTLPGGYSSDSGSEGLPIMARKLAFQAFLISNTLAMCSSLCVAFICIIARWEDLEFLVYYRRLTKKIMWFAYMATTTAFATGLYTILAPRVPWLAIFICAVSFLLPFFTKVVGEWPTLRFKLLIAKSYRAEIIDDFV